MKKFITSLACCGLLNGSFAQTLSGQLQKAFAVFEKDTQLKHAISSLYIMDAKTGAVVFEKNSRVGLAPASTQKIVVAATAYELLGKEYRYATEFGNAGNKDGILVIKPSGDPSFGSGRWKETRPEQIIGAVLKNRKSAGNSPVCGVYAGNNGWETEFIPDGWIWQDLGNYYGAGAHKLNYSENQFDIILKSGKAIGDPVSIVSLDPPAAGLLLKKPVSKLKAAAKGSGDHAYAYFSLYPADEFTLRGTIPVHENNFSISVAMNNPEDFFIADLTDSLQVGKYADPVSGAVRFTDTSFLEKGAYHPFYTHYSPALDSLMYWFLHKSINLYGEALLKTLAYKKSGSGATDTGLQLIKDFWKEKGIDPLELNLYDGSGLSPLNRITTHAQAEILKYASHQRWYPSFYNALPEYNGMKLKSGTISDVRGYCGYYISGKGREYIISFLVNNYNGSASVLSNKMFRVLDILK